MNKKNIGLKEMMSINKFKNQVSKEYKFLFVTDIKKLNFGAACLGGEQT